MEETLPRKRQPRWLILVTLVLAAVLLYFALRRVNLNELLQILQQGNIGLLSLGVITLSISCMMRGLRWRVLLSAEKRLPALDVFWATMIGYLGNAYLPARAGEVLRSVIIGERGGISKMFSLATALTERIADAVILVTVTALALSSLGTLPDEYVQAMKGMAVIGGLGLLIVFIAPRMSNLVQNIIARLPLLSDSLRSKIGGIVGNFLIGAGALQNPARLTQFLLFSAAIWSLDTLTGTITARAFGLQLTPAQVFILLAALGIASAIPSTPGYVGVYQFVAITVLVPFGLNDSQAIAYILAYQGITYVVVTFWGLIGLWQLKSVIRL